jgi:hypothetical protein
MGAKQIFFLILGKLFEQISIIQLNHQLYLLGFITCAFIILFNISQSAIFILLKISVFLVILCAMICDLILVMHIREIFILNKSIRGILLAVIVLLPDLCQVPQSGVLRLAVYLLCSTKPKVNTWFFIELTHFLLLYLIWLI